MRSREGNSRMRMWLRFGCAVCSGESVDRRNSSDCVAQVGGYLWVAAQISSIPLYQLSYWPIDRLLPFSAEQGMGSIRMKTERDTGRCGRPASRDCRSAQWNGIEPVACIRPSRGFLHSSTNFNPCFCLITWTCVNFVINSYNVGRWWEGLEINADPPFFSPRRR